MLQYWRWRCIDGHCCSSLAGSPSAACDRSPCNRRRAPRHTETMRRFQAWGYPVHLIDEKQLRALEPNVVPGTVSSATHAEIEGSADPVGATHVIMARAARAGAKIVYPVEVTGLDLA